MDSSETPMDTQSSAATKQISGPTNVAPSVIVSLHPLVVLNIAEHWTRVRAQIGNKVQVYGALLGRQKGRNIELCTSFEIKMKNPNETSEFAEEIDLEFLNTQIAQFKQVFSDFDFLGWYSCGSEDMSVAGEEKSSSANKYDIHLHKQVCTINESALILKLDPFGKHTDLPVSIFESVIDFIDDEPHIVFIKLEYTLATDEAERIGVDHIAKHSTDSTSSTSSNMIQSTVAEHLNAQYSAITLLYNRIKVICEYIKDVKSGRVKKNNDILREIQSLCHRLPIMNTPNFYKDFYTLFNDVTWIAYLGVIMQSSNTLNQYLNKFLIMHDKSITKRGRSILI